MQNKLKIRIVVFLLTLALILPVGLIVLNSEYKKKLAFAQDNIEIINSVERDFEDYRKEYLAAIQNEKEQNKLKMIEAKLTYEYLLDSQAEIINQHKRQIAVTDNTQQIANSGGSGTTTKVSSTNSSPVKVVSKPTTTRKTKAS